MMKVFLQDSFFSMLTYDGAAAFGFNHPIVLTLLVITAINVQREVGGNLAEILDTISYTIRERVRIKGEIRVLTSQSSYSGKFLSAMPLFVIGILYLLNKEYMQTFFLPSSAPCGYIALGLAGTLIVIGYFVMTKIADIEV